MKTSEMNVGDSARTVRGNRVKVSLTFGIEGYGWEATEENIAGITRSIRVYKTRTGALKNAYRVMEIR